MEEEPALVKMEDLDINANDGEGEYEEHPQHQRRQPDRFPTVVSFSTLPIPFSKLTPARTHIQTHTLVSHTMIVSFISLSPFPVPRAAHEND